MHTGTKEEGARKIVQEQEQIACEGMHNNNTARTHVQGKNARELVQVENASERVQPKSEREPGCVTQRHTCIN